MTRLQIYQDDLNNRFPGYTFNTTVDASLTTFDALDGPTLIQTATKASADDAVFQVRSGLVGGIDVLPRLTTTQRDALTSTVEGTNIVNTTTDSIEKFENATWIPANQILDGNFNFQGLTKIGGNTAVSPDGALDVIGDDAASTRIRTTRYQDNANGGAGIQLGHSRGSEGTPSALLSGDKLGQVLFIGDDGVSENSSGAFVRAYTSQPWSGTAKGCQIRFETIPNNSTSVAISFVVSESGYPEAPSYTVAGLPPVGTGGGFIYVSDETGGATLAFSDGTNWRRVQDRTIVA